MGKKGSKYLLQDGGGAGQGGEDGGDPGPPPKAEVAFDDFDVLRAIGRGAFGKVSALYASVKSVQLIPTKKKSITVYHVCLTKDTKIYCPFTPLEGGWGSPKRENIEYN